MEAGKKISFVIQSRDVQNAPLETPGAVFLSSLTHLDSLDYELRVKRQGLELTHEVHIDDNLDGQYSGSCRLYLTGSYNLRITLDGLPISGSPFDLNVSPGRLHPSRCFCWFGAFAVKASANEVTDGYGEALECLHSQSLVFTVSARDKYGNKCDATDFAVVAKAEYLEPWISDRELALDTSTRTHGQSDSHTTEVRDAEETKRGESTHTQSFCGSSLGLFPCAVDTRQFHPKSRYLLHLAIDKFHGNQAIQGSPFHLTITGDRESTRFSEENKVYDDDGESVGTRHARATAEAFMEAEAKANDKKSPSLKNSKKDRNRQEEELVEELTNQEKTQRRAEEAFKKFKAESRARRDRERAAQKIKRTGGGFVIQFSKDAPF